MLGDLLSNGGSKGESPWLRRNVGGGTGPVMPDRQGVEPLGNELLVNEFVYDTDHQVAVRIYF